MACGAGREAASGPGRPGASPAPRATCAAARSLGYGAERTVRHFRAWLRSRSGRAGCRGRRRRKEPVGPRARASHPPRAEGPRLGGGAAARWRGRARRGGRAAERGRRWAGGGRRRVARRGVSGGARRVLLTPLVDQESVFPSIDPQKEALGHKKAANERNRILILPLLALRWLSMAKGIQTASQAHPGFGPSQAWVTWMSGPRALTGLRGARTGWPSGLGLPAGCLPASPASTQGLRLDRQVLVNTGIFQ